MKLTFNLQKPHMERVLFESLPETLTLEMDSAENADMFSSKFESFQMAAGGDGSLPTDFFLASQEKNVVFSGNIRSVLTIMDARMLIPQEIIGKINFILNILALPEGKLFVALLANAVNSMEEMAKSMPPTAKNQFLDLLAEQITVSKTATQQSVASPQETRHPPSIFSH